MPVIICMLRGVNVGGHNIIKMGALKALCVSLKLKDPQTYVQSGNNIFSSGEKTCPNSPSAFRIPLKMPTASARRGAAYRGGIEGDRREEPLLPNARTSSGKLLVNLFW